MTLDPSNDDRTDASEYLQLDRPQGAASGDTNAGRLGEALAKHGSDSELSRTEWLAVSVALHDASQGHAKVGTGIGRLRRLLRLISGYAPPQPLADPRLEAIRSFVAEARAHHRIHRPLEESLREQGFNRRQIKALGLLSL